MFIRYRLLVFPVPILPEALVPLPPLRDFIVDATFTNPYSKRVGMWDYGFFFSDSSRLYVTCEQLWALDREVNEPKPDTPTTFVTGHLPLFNTAAGFTNTLRLVVQGTQARLFVNDTYATTITIPQSREPGYLQVGTGFIQGNTQSGKETKVRVQVWALSGQ
ncbi:MAG: hypothetical protein HGB28_03680 [Oscillochloris sp.]|nr:hypothetical protein [Oscillochloris sp.]